MKKLWLLAAAALMMLNLTACSDDDDNNSKDDTVAAQIIGTYKGRAIAAGQYIEDMTINISKKAADKVTVAVDKQINLTVLGKLDLNVLGDCDVTFSDKIYTLNGDTQIELKESFFSMMKGTYPVTISGAITEDGNATIRIELSDTNPPFTFTVNFTGQKATSN